MTEVWTDQGTENGQKSGTESKKARVKFGPRANQTVPHEWAEAMLTHLFQTRRKVFGEVLQHAAGVDDD